jgi:hypothetical protein
MLNRSTLIRPVLVAAAGAMLAATAVPAFANEKAGTPTNGSSQMSDEQTQKKICLSPTVTGEPVVTGSMLGKRQCHTKAEWIAKGVIFQSK